MAWTVEKQKQYMRIADRSDAEARKYLNDLPPDFQLLTVQATIAQAYRAGAIDAIFGRVEDSD